MGSLAGTRKPHSRTGDAAGEVRRPDHPLPRHRPSAPQAPPPGRAVRSSRWTSRFPTVRSQSTAAIRSTTRTKMPTSHCAIPSRLRDASWRTTSANVAPPPGVASRHRTGACANCIRMRISEGRDRRWPPGLLPPQQRARSPLRPAHDRYESTLCGRAGRSRAASQHGARLRLSMTNTLCRERGLGAIERMYSPAS